jgi:pimeloyl-ACP methyl ester carboxylesterase
MSTRVKRFLPCAIALVLFVLAGCSEEAVGPTTDLAGVDVQTMQTDMIKTDGFTEYRGLIGGENRYAFLVPDDWNGELVLYAHGFIDQDEPLGLPTKDNAVAIRDRVVAMGFAWAYGSYRENGLAIKDGAWATRQLRNVFIATVKSRPTYTWLIGHSLGGIIGLELAETRPDEFDGLLTIAGMVGGTKAQLDYVAHVRVLFDLFYDQVLPGSVIDVPPSFDLMADVVYPVATAVQVDPTGLGIISRIKQTPLPGRNGAELLESLITALGFNYRGINDVLERTNGACPIENSGTEYEAAAPGMLPTEVLAMINSNVQRFERDTPIEELFERQYEPSGQLTIPMITLHNEFDPVVPLFHEDLYAAKVATCGRSDMLERRVIPRYAHTDFDAQDAADEATDALMALRAKAGATEVMGSGQ